MVVRNPAVAWIFHLLEIFWMEWSSCCAFASHHDSARPNPSRNPWVRRLLVQRMSSRSSCAALLMRLDALISSGSNAAFASARPGTSRSKTSFTTATYLVAASTFEYASGSPSWGHSFSRQIVSIATMVETSDTCFVSRFTSQWSTPPCHEQAPRPVADDRDPSLQIAPTR